MLVSVFRLLCETAEVFATAFLICFALEVARRVLGWLWRAHVRAIRRMGAPKVPLFELCVGNEEKLKPEQRERARADVARMQEALNRRLQSWATYN